MFSIKTFSTSKKRALLMGSCNVRATAPMQSEYDAEQPGDEGRQRAAGRAGRNPAACIGQAPVQHPPLGETNAAFRCLTAIVKEIRS
jgi:hypothetical protein